eukprot:CAMPEP_0175845942 /NCGR_PEP_ID=MMETSP0107_2-20121207/22507_1 /TAXON_ID=195067 ORGANISM="Goniomonas pacifica, Strain CCMP1869" /NCGR_SAMPLE_ID=MMETSP0107_2 /ASSEMBLY_ACC=CAM_ASM_000203 /LENGTH=65 /DNA_ID=CAMNT_0017160561 /DNA_START=205 /DNA_END=402 /DNA_ORIENTATION=+
MIPLSQQRQRRNSCQVLLTQNAADKVSKSTATKVCLLQVVAELGRVLTDNMSEHVRRSFSVIFEE